MCPPDHRDVSSWTHWMARSMTSVDVLRFSFSLMRLQKELMVAMVTLFPTRQLGLELGSVLLIFTGQVWNMAFSVYSSTKMIPPDLLDAAHAFRLSWWQRFVQLELPYAAIGLVWNSMMSVAGGWFFLMACEMFVLGNRDLRLPGLGSYLQTASNAGSIRSIVWGLVAMIGVIGATRLLPAAPRRVSSSACEALDRKSPRRWAGLMRYPD